MAFFLGSNGGMNNARSLEDRVADLEIRFSDNDDLLDTLNRIVVQQQDIITRLNQEVAKLKHQLAQMEPAPAFRSLRDELPPHY